MHVIKDKTFKFSLQLLFLCWLSSLHFSAQGQYPRNFSISNYSALTGVAYNPASLADSRHRFALTPLSFYTEVGNNYVNLRTPYSQWKVIRNKVPEDQLDENDIPVFYSTFLEDKLNQKSKQAFMATDITGPSFMLGLKNKGGIAFGTRTRSFMNMKNLNEDLMKIFLDDFDTTYAGWTPDAHQLQYVGKPNHQNKFGLGVLAYQEFSGSYAGILLDDKENFLKGGITLKYMIGLGATYLTVNNLDYELLDVDSIRLNGADMNLAYIHEDYYTDSDRRLFDYFGKNKLGKGSAIDIGIIYEYRPKYREYYYRMDRKRVEDRTANKYLFKFGASISDFGRIRFNNPEFVRQRNIYSDTLVDWSNFKSVKSFGGSEDIDSFIFTLFPSSDSTNMFDSKLPASLNLMFDLQLAPNWYMGSTWVQTLRGNKVNGVRKQNVISVGGRYESRKFEAGTNLVFGKFYNPILLGMYVRLGPVYIGSDNLGGIFTAKSTNGVNLFAGVQLPILHNKIPDMDGDQVSDEKDKCPDEFGSPSAKGCPDADDDRVPDSEDRCPDIAGDRKTEGCPDPDGDGLVSVDDKCPDRAGTLETNGCPDSDGDGIYDDADRCPDDFGPASNKGCPEISVDTVAEIERPIIEPERPKKEVKPILTKPEKDMTVRDVVDVMNFEDYDYYLILGVYENKLLADVLVRRLNREAKVMTYIYLDEVNNLNYVTFGRAIGTEMAIEQLSQLDKPKVNHLINGHVWWKKVPK